MIVWGWILIVIGAIVNFLAKPVLAKAADGGEVNEKALYGFKIAGMLIVIIGAALIYIAGGRVDVGAIG